MIQRFANDSQCDLSVDKVMTLFSLSFIRMTQFCVNSTMTSWFDDMTYCIGCSYDSYLWLLLTQFNIDYVAHRIVEAIVFQYEHNSYILNLMILSKRSILFFDVNRVTRCIFYIKLVIGSGKGLHTLADHTLAYTWDQPLASFSVIRSRPIITRFHSFEFPASL